MRTFYLARHEDVSGVSGTGIVAEGVEFSDGKCAIRWIVGDHRSVVVWDSVGDVQAIHGHDGKTRIMYESNDGQVYCWPNVPPGGNDVRQDV